MSGTEDAIGRLNTVLHDDMMDKYEVPLHGDLKNRLDWFAGYMDADGTVAWNGNSASLQASSINRTFIYKVQLMLQTMGIITKLEVIPAATRSMPDGHGSMKDFECVEIYRMTISCWYTHKLLEMGYSPKRLSLVGAKIPQRSASQFVTVVSVIDDGRIDDTYCFNEPVNNTGVFNGILTGQCCEIFEVTTEDEIASCNLASINLARFPSNRFLRHGKEKRPFHQLYDFKTLGKTCKEVVNNLDRVIDCNYYPLDKRDAQGNVTEKGPISSPNYRDRPLGIGVSGLADAFFKLDIAYDSPEAEQMNKMIFACMYFNSLVASLELSLKKGHYATFRTGSYKRYIGNGHFKTEIGSPIANGQLQFDLWAEEAQMLDDMGRLNKKVYNMDDDKPVPPAEWGQEPIHLTGQDVDGDDYDITIEPTWESLRDHIVRLGVRHSLLLALMPTATTSQIMRNAETTEQHQAMIYVRNVRNESFTIIITPLIEDLKELGLWSRNLSAFIIECQGSVQLIDHYIMEHPNDEGFDPSAFTVAKDGTKTLRMDVFKSLQFVQKKYRTMFEIPTPVILKYARQRGIYIDQSQSTNIFERSPDIKKMIGVHTMGNMLRLKTGMYYLRMKPAIVTANFAGHVETEAYRQDLLRRLAKDSKVDGTFLNAMMLRAVASSQEVCVDCSA